MAQMGLYVRDLHSIPVTEIYPGEGIGYPLHFSCLENSMKRGEEPGGLESMGHKELDKTEQLNFHVMKHLL